MKREYLVGEFVIYKLEQDEEVEKGCQYGLITRDRVIRTNDISPIDMDFYEKSLKKAFERAMQWS